MNQDEPSAHPPRRRFWLKLLLWSAVGTGMVFSVVSQDAFNPANGPATTRQTVIQGLRLACIGVTVLVLFFTAAKCWPQRPKSQRGWFILTTASLFLGLATVCWFAGNGMFRTLNFLGPPLLVFTAMTTGFYFCALFALRSTRIFCRWFFRWRIFVPCALLVLLLAGAVIVFHVAENRRGQRAWDSCRRELEAQGEKFSLLDYAPPPVPDEQNFALAAVITTTYANAPGYDGNHFPTNVENRLTLTLEREDITTMPTRHIGDWRQGSRTDLRPWQVYYRARFLTNELNNFPGLPNPFRDSQMANEFPIADHEQSPAADVLLALSKFDATIEDVRLAGARPGSRYPLAYRQREDQQIYSFQSSHQYPLDNFAFILQLRAIAEVQAGQTDRALADVELMLRLADAIKNEPIDASSIHRAIIIGRSIQPIWEGLAAYAWTPAQLQTLQAQLARQDCLADVLLGWRSDRILTLNFLQHEKTNRTEYATMLLLSHLHFEQQDLSDLFHLPEPLARFLDESLEPINNSKTFQQLFATINHAAPGGWFDLEKTRLAATVQQYLTNVVQPERHVVDRAVVAELVKTSARRSQRGNLGHYGYYDLMFTEGMPQDFLRAAKTQNAVDMAIIACALERFHLAQHDYPETLAALVPQYLEKIPPDVINGQSLHYQRKSQDAFQLYSVGWDGKDDGGSTALHYSGRRESDTADWVWEYPVKQ
jgi:hypothetical protein